MWIHFSSDSNLELNLINKNPSKNFNFKPYGLWLSNNNEWELYCKLNNLYIPKYKYIITIEHLNMYIINNIKDLYKLIDVYWDIEFNYINWINVKNNNFDGIIFYNYNIIYNQTLDSIYFEKLLWFRTLDISSACIWNATKIKNLKKIN